MIKGFQLYFSCDTNSQQLPICNKEVGWRRRYRKGLQASLVLKRLAWMLLLRYFHFIRKTKDTEGCLLEEKYFAFLLNLTNSIFICSSSILPGGCMGTGPFPCGVSGQGMTSSCGAVNSAAQSVFIKTEDNTRVRHAALYIMTSAFQTN